VDDLLDLPGDAPVDVRHRPENVAKLARRVAAQPLKLLHPPRAGKKLLVLDIDYTLFDHRSTAETPHELARPFLHEFLASAYLSYDIVIWSATSMKWIEVKMRELGVLGHEQYRIAALVDHGAMITVGPLPDYGVFDCKPLGYLWAQHDGWTERNTIMFDDLRRNFVMNPQQGLRIRPFRNAHSARSTDDELLRLSVYLGAIAALDDFSSLDHRRWESYRPPRAPRAPPPEAARDDEDAA
jgi:ubiquitin-like domain-containing CTD phosphatase 1